MGRLSARRRRSVKRKLYRRDGMACAWCGVALSPDEVTFDHNIPTSKGGSSRQTNLVCSCALCNSDKADRVGEEYVVMIKQAQELKAA